MADEIKIIRGLPFRIYETKQGTWKAYYNKKVLHRATRANLMAAMDEYAQTLLGITVSVKLSQIQSADYHKAMELLAPFGVTLSDAARFYAEAKAKIKRQVSLEEAMKLFKTEQESLVEQDELSAHYCNFSGYVFRKFSAGKEVLLHECGDRLAEQLRVVKLRGRGFNNARGTMITFWKWAQGRGFVPNDKGTPFDAVPRKKENGEEVTVYSPAQLAALLKYADDRAQDFIFLGAFFGVRSAEIERLTGADVHVEHKVIEVAAHKAKTGQRRLVPIPDDWLEKARAMAGQKVFWKRSYYEFLHDSIEGKVPFPKNVLRHSWISYKLAETGNIDQVAADAGTSREKIFKNYRALRTLDGLPVTKQLAAKWFALASSAEV